VPFYVSLRLDAPWSIVKRVRDTACGCKRQIQRSFTGCGVCIFDGGLGTYEENIIRDNFFSGMEIGGEETNVTVGKNEIHSNHGDGILLYDGSTCTLTANKIYRNWHCGVEVKDGAKLTAEENSKPRPGFLGFQSLGSWAP